MDMKTHALILPPPAFRASDAVQAEPTVALTGLTRLIAFSVLFLAGWYLCLPETDMIELPFWASKIEFGPNILPHEVVFVGYLMVGGLAIVLRNAARRQYITIAASVCLVLLALWCATTSLLAPYPAHDVGRSARLVMQAVLLLALTHWSAASPLFVLRSFLLGLAVGSAINLVFTFQHPLTAAVLPRLLGQNSPGPPMGIAVCLVGWLILLSRRRADSLMAMIVAATCGVGALISYSKTGMLAAMLGFAGIALVAMRVSPSTRGRVVIGVLGMLTIIGIGFLGSETGRPIWGAFTVMVSEKVESARPEESTSVQERWSYVLGVSEIVARNPLGVGYSGFRDAMMQTDVYASGRAADESTVDAADSNPHSLFLYYASAGGVLGAILCVAVFALLCAAFLYGIGSYGVLGKAMALFLATAYFVLGTSVPYLFNSSVMLVPAALAAGLHARVAAPRSARL